MQILPALPMVITPLDAGRELSSPVVITARIARVSALFSISHVVLRSAEVEMTYPNTSAVVTDVADKQTVGNRTVLRFPDSPSRDPIAPTDRYDRATVAAVRACPKPAVVAVRLDDAKSEPLFKSGGISPPRVSRHVALMPLQKTGGVPFDPPFHPISLPRQWGESPAPAFTCSRG